MRSVFLVSRDFRKRNGLVSRTFVAFGENEQQIPILVLLSTSGDIRILDIACLNVYGILQRSSSCSEF